MSINPENPESQFLMQQLANIIGSLFAVAKRPAGFVILAHFPEEKHTYFGTNVTTELALEIMETAAKVIPKVTQGEKEAMN